ncbi:MAG TPA: histone deacetylase [Opitutus sp.]|nr:histone deacetylase [Opitutus sp.]
MLAGMLILYDPQCAGYGSSMRPEQPARAIKSAEHLRAAHPDWIWRVPAPAPVETLLLAHAPEHVARLREPRDFDEDTPYFDGIYDHARRAAGAAVSAAEIALMDRQPVFSLMRPPGHHATADQAMGFCYLNNIAVAALFARQKLHAPRVAVWDFDAHHGNGTEAILHRQPGILFASIHQSPGYPGSGLRTFDNCLNWSIRPRTDRTEHLAALRESLDQLVAFRPTLLLVSAGFDAYARDPITSMTLEADDFRTLGQWVRESGLAAAAILEGGYSPDLPLLIDAFVSAWEK